MHLATDDYIRAHITERHRQARERRFVFGVLMQTRSRRKAEEARLHAERALAEQRGTRAALPVPS